nr:hypothetical protein [Borrelia puertoricensis]
MKTYEIYQICTLILCEGESVILLQSSINLLMRMMIIILIKTISIF